MATVVANNNPFWGMVIYEIRGDGTLSGTWKNNRHSNADSVLNEIARKTTNTPGIAGTYSVSWIEENNQPHTGTLMIDQIQNNTALSFIWLNGNVSFRGMGMPIGQNQIAVTYWDTQNPLQLNF
jgi:hypothetical protein